MVGNQYFGRLPIFSFHHLIIIIIIKFYKVTSTVTTIDLISLRDL